MDCLSKLKECKAGCCGPVPFTRDEWEINKIHKVVKEDVLFSHPSGAVIPLIPGFRCIFLRNDYKCNIYDTRPEICRKFGKIDDVLMNCPYH